MRFLKLCLPFALALLMMGCDQSADQPADQSIAVATTEPVATSTDLTSEINQASESNLPATAPTYTLVIDRSYPPFSFMDEYGLATGFDIDVLTAIGEETGFRVEAMPVGWDGIFDRLENESADLVGGVSITPERAEKYELTDPHIVTDIVFAYIDEEERTFEELLSGTISAQDSTSYLTELREVSGINEAKIRTYPTSYLAFKDMITGNTDAVFNNRAILEYEVASVQDQIDVDNLKMLRLPGSEDSLEVFAIKKGNTELLNQVNEGLAIIQANGKYDEIRQRWFADLS